MNLFEIIRVCQAEFNDDWEWTGAMTIDYVFAYDQKDLEDYLFMSKINGMEAEVI